jgi:predicted nucleic acid-binding protein
MPGLVYDTGALIAAERRVDRLRLLHEEALRARVRPLVPVVVLAQAWRGGPQAGMSRVLRGCKIAADTEEAGRRAGRACARAGTDDAVDALVVVTALALDAAVVTSDPDDLHRVAHALGHQLKVHAI